jgi:hypothetical protein
LESAEVDDAGLAAEMTAGFATVRQFSETAARPPASTYACVTGQRLGTICFCHFLTLPLFIPELYYPV